MLPVALAAGLVGCFSFGPIWAPRIEGRVVDAATGEPVAGAEVFASYQTYMAGTDHWEYAVPIDSRWATTGPDGRFAIPEHWAIEPVAGSCGTAKHPWLFVYHPAYGVVAWNNNVNLPARIEQRKQQFWRSVVIEIAPWDVRADASQTSRTSHLLAYCRDLTPQACQRLCEISVGWDACLHHERDLAEERSKAAAERASKPPPVLVNPGGPTFARPRIVRPST